MVCTLTLGSAGICYAADVAGIRTTLSMWLSGQKQEVEVEQVEEGIYKMTGENGEEIVISGTMYTDDENTTAMTPEELAAYMNNDMTLTETDGRMYFTYRNLTIDVTGDIDAEGKLYVHVDDPSNPETYFDISNIDGSGYESQANSTPTPGAEYVEVDSDSLAEDVPALQNTDSDLVTTTTIVTSD